MSEQENVSYRDLFPEYAAYVDNPDAIDEPIKTSKLYDLLIEWEKDEHFPYSSFDTTFIFSIAVWARRIQKYEAYMQHIFDDYDFENPDQNTNMLRYAIVNKLETFSSRSDKCNFLLGLKKEIDQGGFFVSLDKDDDKIRLKVVTELEYWKNLIETEGPDTSKTTSRVLTHKKVMLLIYYLGLLDKLQSHGMKKETEAKILSDIISFDEKNTKTFIANINYISFEASDDASKSYKNLDFAWKYFNENGLYDIANRVKEDLEKSKAEKK